MVNPPAPRDGTTYGFACVEATINLDGRVVEAVVRDTNSPRFCPVVSRQMQLASALSRFEMGKSVTPA